MKYIYYTIGLLFASVAFILAIPAGILSEISGIFYHLYENKADKREKDGQE